MHELSPARGWQEQPLGAGKADDRPHELHVGEDHVSPECSKRREVDCDLFGFDHGRSAAVSPARKGHVTQNGPKGRPDLYARGLAEPDAVAAPRTHLLGNAVAHDLRRGYQRKGSDQQYEYDDGCAERPQASSCRRTWHSSSPSGPTKPGRPAPVISGLTESNRISSLCGRAMTNCTHRLLTGAVLPRCGPACITDAQTEERHGRNEAALDPE